MKESEYIKDNGIKKMKISKRMIGKKEEELFLKTQIEISTVLENFFSFRLDLPRTYQSETM